MPNENDLPIYELSITEPAEIDIDGVYLRILRSSIDAAERWHNGLLTSLDTLLILPRAYPVAPESVVMGKNVRVMLYGKGRSAYRVLYAVIEAADGEPGIVRIQRVIHAMRRPYGEDED